MSDDVTTPSTADREALVELIYSLTIASAGSAEDAADAILARWRLVPVDASSDPDRAIKVSDELAKLVWPLKVARLEAQRQAQRDAGQVWWAVYWYYHSEKRAEMFSLDEALSLFRGMSEYGTGAPNRIECPDGTVITDSDLWID